jgi:hypothetical protein
MELPFSRAEALRFVSYRGAALQLMPAEYRDDEEICLRAVGKSAGAMRFVSGRLRGDLKFTQRVAAAMPALYRNPQFVQRWLHARSEDVARAGMDAAVASQRPALVLDIFREMPEPLRVRLDFFLWAQERSTLALLHYAQPLAASADAAAQAVHLHGGNLDFVNPELHPTDVMLGLARAALRAARAPLTSTVSLGWKARADREVALGLLRANELNLHGIDALLQQDPAFMLEAVRANGRVLLAMMLMQRPDLREDLSAEVLPHKDFILEAFRSCASAWRATRSAAADPRKLLQDLHQWGFMLMLGSQLGQAGWETLASLSRGSAFAVLADPARPVLLAKPSLLRYRYDLSQPAVAVAAALAPDACPQTLAAVSWDLDSLPNYLTALMVRRHGTAGTVRSYYRRRAARISEFVAQRTPMVEYRRAYALLVRSFGDPSALCGRVCADLQWLLLQHMERLLESGATYERVAKQDVLLLRGTRPAVKRKRQ